MRQGDVFWLRFGGEGPEPLGRRPAVIVQDDRFNLSAIQTTIVCAITTNLRLADAPGNLRLRKGEANLPQASVVNVTQIRTIDRSRITLRLGTLGPQRLDELRRGLALVIGIRTV